MEKFNKKGLHIRFDLSAVALEKCYMTTSWSYLCKLCKPIAITLANNEYFKFKWLGCTVIFWKINDKIYKELQ